MVKADQSTLLSLLIALLSFSRYHAFLLPSHPRYRTRIMAHVDGGSSSADVEVFRRIVLNRRSAHDFKSDPIPASVLKDILLLTQRAPSSWNIQPYKLFVLQSKEVRDALAKAMLGGNAKKVQTAPVSVVFAADLESGRNDAKLQVLLRRAAFYPEEVIKKVPFLSKLFSTGHRFWFVRCLMFTLKTIAFNVLGLFMPLPRIERPETWAAKNTILAAQNFMLAASAYGLGTCPMEGFDASRVKKAAGVPRGYSVPLVVTLGYEEEGEHKASERFPLEEVAFAEHGKPLAFA